MKKLTLLIAAMLLMQWISAQGNVALHSAGAVKMYFGSTGFENAVLDSKSGDTLYISGGSFSAGYAINHRLVIFGTGYFPDSSKATGISIINGNVSLSSGCSGTWIEGLNISGNVITGYYDTCHNIRLHRCYLGGSVLLDQRASLIHNNFTITECNFSQLSGGNTVRNLYIGNSIVRYGFYNIDLPALIENNYIYSTAYNYMFNSIQWVTFRNNIINNSYWPGVTVNSVYNSKFKNNLWSNSIGGSYLSNDTAKEKVGYNTDSVFKYVPALGFDWNYNFQLRPSAASKYRGTDGSEIGIYGGTLSSWKEGAIPRNPHLQQAEIAEQTDAAGKLKIKVRVQAQKR